MDVVLQQKRAAFSVELSSSGFSIGRGRAGASFPRFSETTMSWQRNISLDILTAGRMVAFKIEKNSSSGKNLALVAR